MSAAAPPLSEVSKTSYETNIERFKRHGVDPTNTETTMAYINKYKSINTQKTYIVAVLKMIADDPALETQRTFYRAKVRELNLKQLDVYKDQKLSVAEERKYVEWPYVLETVKQIHADPYISDDDKLLASLYTELPPMRVDYVGLRIYHSPPAEDVGNYVVLRSRGSYIKLNNHKTAKFGAIVNKLPAPLKRRFSEYVRSHPTATTLFDMEPNALSKRITRIFARYSSKMIGVNILRHSFISHFLATAPSLRAMEDMAKRMGHSTTLQQYYRRVAEDKSSSDSSSSDSDSD